MQKKTLVRFTYVVILVFVERFACISLDAVFMMLVIKEQLSENSELMSIIR